MYKDKACTGYGTRFLYVYSLIGAENVFCFAHNADFLLLRSAPAGACDPYACYKLYLFMIF